MTIHLEKLEIKNQNFFKPKGCRECNGTGYKGRTGLFELLVVSEEIEELVANRIADRELREKVIVSGMKTLKEDGLEKVSAGITTLEEILRVIQ